MPACPICGNEGFKTWQQYNEHHKRKHNVTLETGVPRLDLGAELQPARQFKEMDKAKKREIVEAMESRIRADAWLARKLNPLIGTDKQSSEPVWNENLEVL